MKNEVRVMNAKIEVTYKNAEMNKYMTAINKAETLGKKSAFTIAENVIAIFDTGCWKDDFKTEADLITALGYSPAMLSQWKHAVDYSKKDASVKKLGYSVNRAYAFSVLDRKGELEDFRKWCMKNNADISTDAKLKDAITHFHGKLTPEEKKNSTDAEVKEVKTATAKSNTLEGAVKVVTIEFEGTVFSVPEKEFKALMKKYTPKQSGKKAKQ